MSLPILLHSGMTGAPSLYLGNGRVNAVLKACLVDGFNVKSVTSATASGGVVTFNFASAPGFGSMETVEVAGAANTAVNGKFRTVSAANNQVLVSIPGVPDGAVSGTITLKYPALGWTLPYTSGTTTYCFRQGGNETFKRFLRVSDSAVTSNNAFYTRAYEAMTAVSTGTGLFPSTATYAGNGIETQMMDGGAIATSAARQWFLVGTARSFYFCFDMYGYGTAGAGSVNPLTTPGLIKLYTGGFFFGDLNNVAKPGDQYAQYLCLSAYGPLNFVPQNCMPRLHSGVAGAVEGARVAGAAMTGMVYPSPSTGGLTVLSRAAVFDTEAVRGTMPGALVIGERPTAATTPVNGGTIFTGIPGITGRSLLALGQPINSDFLLALDEDWGEL